VKEMTLVAYSQREAYRGLMTAGGMKERMSVTSMRAPKKKMLRYA